MVLYEYNSNSIKHPINSVGSDRKVIIASLEDAIQREGLDLRIPRAEDIPELSERLIIPCYLSFLNPSQVVEFNVGKGLQFKINANVSGYLQQQLQEYEGKKYGELFLLDIGHFIRTWWLFPRDVMDGLKNCDWSSLDQWAEENRETRLKLSKNPNLYIEPLRDFERTYH